ncbi:RHS repeat-associated core domain-containing protein [Desulfovibrio sp. JC010]|uniref:RHS repeat-associated core domain-containing protein n=1 Tax=Desulfovibrio sp. JC010 TaxID=2593641 RepID=UPI0013D761A0|nr:RHS repeat-associated core domain-containing protein [Desulfovibrio sp. JC010]NDV25428.1 hypothetical protein [Desulfovibrio sp. JC010]
MTSFKPRTPSTGTGANLFDEFERDDVDYSPEDAVRVTPFAVPGVSEPFSVLATKRDENGRIVERALEYENFTQHFRYEYDAGGRLHKVWSGESLIEEYLYGKSGERYFGVTSWLPNRSFRYGPGLRLEKAGKVKYSYDSEGRLTAKQFGPEVTRYSYHESGQLQQVKLPDGRRISYEIDDEGKRISKFINTQKVETYHWHDFTTLAAVADHFGNTREFAYDEDGDPIAMRFNENVYYFAADQVGTICIVANDAGNEVKRIIRDSFGNKIVDTNKQMEIALGFAGGLYDKDTGLVHFGFREYDPTIGRFIQPDPLGLAGGDVDVYGYCADDPVNFVDRVGLFSRGSFGDFGEGTGGAGSRRGSSSDNSGGGAIGGLTGRGKGALSGLVDSVSGESNNNSGKTSGSGNSTGAINGLLGKGKGILSGKLGGEGNESNNNGPSGSSNSTGSISGLLGLGGDVLSGLVGSKRGGNKTQSVKSDLQQTRQAEDKARADQQAQEEQLAEAKAQKEKAEAEEVKEAKKAEEEAEKEQQAAARKTAATPSPLKKAEDELQQAKKSGMLATKKSVARNVPAAPKGVSVDENMAKAKAFGKKADLLPSVYSRLAKYGYLAHQFGPGREQDYKTRGREYEHFGNYNFGAAAKALGISELEAKAGAGAVQVFTGTAKASWWGDFFDDPVDQQNIANGYRHGKK